MRSVIIIIGILQVLGGIWFFIVAKSAIHEILGSLSFGLGILSIALGVAIGELVAIRKAAEARAPVDSHRNAAPATSHPPSGGLNIAHGEPMRWPDP